MLEVDPTIAEGTPRIEVHPLGIGGREDPVRMVFNAAEGDGITLGLCDLGDRFRMVANEITVVKPLADMPNLPVARAVWAAKPDFTTSTECWLTAGGPHHTVLSTQVNAEHLTDLAEMLGTELALIGADTKTAQFIKELRWNNAYYRLALGF